MGALDFVASVLQVIKCLWDCVSPHVTLVGELENNLQSLRCATEGLRDLNEDVKRRVELAEQHQVVRTRKQVEGWLQRSEILEKEASRIIERGEREVQSKCLWGRCPKNFGSSHRVGGRVERALVKVKEESSKGCFEVVADELPYDLAEERPLENVVGLELIFRDVWKCIVDEKVGVIGLYGLGGVGKTTLLTKINNEFVHRNHEFKLAIWVVMSKQTKVDEMQEIIHNRVNLKDANWHRKTEHEKAASIYKFLKGKKFVLLLDDMMERIDLARVGVPLSSDGNKGKVVFTTRFQEVCSQMEAQTRIEVTCLAKSQANILFNTKVGDDTLKSHPEIRNLAQTVSEECHGLPLALITIGRAMAGKKDPRLWKRAVQVLKDSPSKFQGMRDHVFQVLRFSYDSLNDETIKQCFLYCSIFPENYDIPKETLIEYWISDGLINNPYDINEARHQGNDFIEILKNACLLESNKDGVSADSIKMHAVIRDMGLWISNEDTNEGDKIVVEHKTRIIDAIRIAKWDKAEKIAVFGADKICNSPTCPDLRTLVVRDCGLTLFPSGFFLHLPALRVLDLSNNRDLAELPEEITMLVTLQYLDLSRTRVESLPAEFRNLTKMRHLLLNNMMDLTTIPQDVISKFLHLRVLSMNYTCSDDSLDEVIEDNVLSNGKECLLHELQLSENLQDLSLILTTLESVTKLLGSERLRRCTRNLYLKRCKNMTKIIVPYSSIDQMINLERLEIRNCRNLNQMTVIQDSAYDSTGFRNLHSVTITNCSMVEMSWLMHVPNLESLHLQGCKLLEEVIRDDQMLLNYENHQTLFSKLSSIILFDLPQLKALCPRPLPFPCLERMTVTLCSALRTLPFDSTSCQGRLKEIVGWPSWWDSLEWNDDGIEPIFRAHFRSSN
ncbi:putative disease resistance protein At5g63020 [Silene latifolia]|uniref:putative disease resistance protein At5g63020 n=1 Tax=Silene latifolia TaxID=37657 RepID=UPI003D76C59F